MSLTKIIKSSFKILVTLLLTVLTSLAVANAQTGSCKPFAFNVAPEYKIGQNIFTFTSADLNGDGYIDVITPNYDGQSISILNGDGAGGFAPPQIFSLGTQVINIITAADINRDGKIDLVGASSGSFFNTNKIVVLLNNGQGSFLAPVINDLPNNVIEFYDLKVADFNGDGNPDIAGVTRTNLNLFLGNGQGGVSLRTTIPWSGDKQSLAVGRFNNDNLTDLAVTSKNNTTGWELGIVLGTSGGFTVNNTYTLTGQPTGVEVGDFNGDAITDIVVSANYIYSNSTPQTRFVEPWLGNGSGGFSAGTKVQFPVLTSGLTVGDFNNDGKQDFAVNLGIFIGVAYGFGNGTFRNRSYFLSPGANALLSADTNQDNKKDLLLLRSGASSSVAVLRNTGDSFATSNPIFEGGTDIVAADFNNDGRRDMVTATDTLFAETSEVVIALNDGQTGLLEDRNFETPTALTTLAVGDFNGDGNKDVVTSHSNNARRLASFLGDGQGNLILPSQQITWVNGVETIITGDFNGDAKDDVFIVDGAQNGYTYLSLGNGNFSQVQNFSIGQINYFTKPETGDFNRDGKLDLLVLTANGVTLQLGNGNGTFTQSFNQTLSIDSIAKGDFNGDGFLDIAALRYNGATIITKLFGDGNGGFSRNSVQTIESGRSYSLTGGDFNLDGIDDVAFINNSGTNGNLAIVPSNAQTLVTENPVYYWVGGMTSAIIAADYNGDNKVDIGFTGRYQARGIVYNTSGQTPCLSVNDVTVTERNSENVTANFTVNLSAAVQQDVYVSYTVEGQSATVGTDFQNVSGRLKIPAGQTSGSIAVTVNGDLFDEFDENFIIHLASPLNASLQKADGVGTILDNDAEPTVTITDVTAPEGINSQQFVFNVALSAPSGKPISFRSTTADGTAVSGRDYFPANNVLNIAPGTSAVNIGVTVIGDSTYELSEDFFVNLSEQVNVSFADSQGKGTITNDDPIPSVSLFTPTVTEGDRGTVSSQITVQLSNPTYLPVTLNVLTNDGTAVGGRDYVASDTTVVIPAEQQSATTSVQIIGDTINEPNETFNVNVYNVTNATVGIPQFSIFIIDDEPVANDFDRDGKTDIAVFRPSDRTWYFSFSSNNSTSASLYGLSTDIPVSGDYNGDARTDIALFRPSNGVWYTPIAGRTQQFGLNGDIPVHGDYDNDGRVDLAVFRPSDRNWYIQRSSNGAVDIVQWGLSNDTPVPADYDGDGKTDIAVFRPDTGVWHILRSTDGGYSSFGFGTAVDKPVPADYDGDGKADAAVFRNGVWTVLRSSDSGVTVFQWGIEGDKPVPGNYDGDSKTDFAIYRNGVWWIWLSSTNNYTIKQFGLTDDIPIPFVSNN